ncbi:MAG TPA: hypothetical protein VE978_09030 [Chitinophagales bacterium]|nr:hypothetical protein [Chitinophagales bacterium]
MKKILFLGKVIFLLTCFSSCMKYDDGPCISFRGEEKRLEGEWLLKYWTVDGIDSLQYWNEYFNGECNFTFGTWAGEGMTGFTIKWGDSSSHYQVAGSYGGFLKEFLPIIGFLVDSSSSAFPLSFLRYPNPNNFEVEWTTTRLKYKEVWFKMDVNNKHYEIHLENIKKP